MIRFNRKKRGVCYGRQREEIDPDEVLIDSSNLPNFDVHQFEGRLEKSISRRSIFVLAGVVLLIISVFTVRAWSLQIEGGEEYFSKSEKNRLRQSLVFSKRGVIYDREGVELAWNKENSQDKAYDLRQYTESDGLSHLLGYLKYPSKDKFGFYWNEFFDGKAGIEEFYNNILSGQNGRRIVEVDALGDIQSENIVRNPVDGEDLYLSISSAVQNKMYEEIKGLAERVGFSGGAGIILDVNTGEVLAMTSYPEYDSQVMTDGQDEALINNYLQNKNNFFLNRLVDGLYTPGSTVKPFVSYAALSEKIIDPYKNLYSSGSLTVPNPYDPDKPTVFKDWKAHGYVDMKKALAVSSDVYFYIVGGGFEDQAGLGIARIDKYMKMFGFGESLVSPFFSGAKGVVPTPEWKKETFEGDDWRLGNTYHTSIGQYGFQVTPLQMLRAVSALANGGRLMEPKILFENKNIKEAFDQQGDFSITDLKLNSDYLKIVKDGMRDGVIKDYGTVKGLNSEQYSVAAKTGTAELGAKKDFVNSWVTGFYPYENPKYAFVVIMERGPVTNTTGATYVMRQVLDYLAVYKPEYLK